MCWDFEWDAWSRWVSEEYILSCLFSVCFNEDSKAIYDNESFSDKWMQGLISYFPSSSSIELRQKSFWYIYTLEQELSIFIKIAK